MSFYRIPFTEEFLKLMCSYSFKEGGISPKYLIIDDGWQETVNEFQKEGEPLIEGTQ